MPIADSANQRRNLIAQILTMQAMNQQSAPVEPEYSPVNPLLDVYDVKPHSPTSSFGSTPDQFGMPDNSLTQMALSELSDPNSPQSGGYGPIIGTPMDDSANGGLLFDNSMPDNVKGSPDDSGKEQADPGAFGEFGFNAPSPTMTAGVFDPAGAPPGGYDPGFAAGFSMGFDAGASGDVGAVGAGDVAGMDTSGSSSSESGSSGVG